MSTVTFLEPAKGCEETARAQQYLDTAKESLTSTFDAIEIVRQRFIDEGKRKPGGRGTNEEMDLRRMAIVFAGGAIDASLKRLLRDALVAVAQVNDEAATEFRTFAERTLRGEGDLAVDHKSLVGILVSDAASPRDALLDLYVEERTKGSLQSVEEVVGVSRALGVADKRFVARVAKPQSRLRQLFRARNHIVHELDLQEYKPGRRRRRDRSKTDTEAWALEAVWVSQTVIDEVARQLLA